LKNLKRNLEAEVDRFYIFADFHLGINEQRDKEIIEKFLKTIEKLPEGTNIVLLGDIFDFWFEYKEVILKKYFPFLSGIWKYKDKLNFYFVAGNHDWWTGNFLEFFGIKTTKGHFTFDIENKKILMAHGDGYFPRDIFGNLLTKILRNKITTGIFYMFHPDIGFQIAKGISRISRHNSSKKEVPHEIPPKVIKHFEEGYDVVILGHFHLPIFMQKDKKLYLNTGDFPGHESYIKIENNEISLISKDKVLFKSKIGG